MRITHTHSPGAKLIDMYGRISVAL